MRYIITSTWNWCRPVKFYLSWIFNITGKILSENGTSHLLFKEMSGDDIFTIWNGATQRLSNNACLTFWSCITKHTNIRTNGSNLVASGFRTRILSPQVLLSYPNFMTYFWLYSPGSRKTGKTNEHFGRQIFQLLIQVFLLRKKKIGKYYRAFLGGIPWQIEIVEQKVALVSSFHLVL